MDKIIEKISDSELEIMQVLWKAKEALPLSAIRTALQSSIGWEATTIKTLLQRLVTKKAVTQEKREVFYYSAAVGEREYNDWATQRLVKRLYHGRARELVAALVHSDELTESDFDELRELFRTGEGSNEIS